jgi:hypothetical protein
LLQTGTIELAVELAHAADAAASSAEHVFRKCYVTRGGDSHFDAGAKRAHCY